MGNDVWYISLYAIDKLCARTTENWGKQISLGGYHGKHGGGVRGGGGVNLRDLV